MHDLPLVARLLILMLMSWNAVSGQNAARPVILAKNVPVRTGAVLREKREIRVDAGQTSQQVGSDTTRVATRFVQRVNLLRRSLGSGGEEVQVREMVTECVHFNPALPPAANEQPAALSSRTLRSRLKSGRWDYDLVGGTPSADEKKLLDDLAFTANLLEILPACIGAASRKVGEKWNTQIPAPRGKAYGWVVPDSLESTLVSVEERPDGPHATIGIEGKFHMERPMNFNARMEITFSATIMRRLSDMVDVDTKVNGRFVGKAESVTPQKQPIILSYDHPFTLTRTLKIEDK